MPDRTRSSRRFIYLKTTLLALILGLVATSRLRADSGMCGGQTIVLSRSESCALQRARPLTDLVTNLSTDSISLWRATDLTPLSNFSVGARTDPQGACRDGQYFWITLRATGRLAGF